MSALVTVECQPKKRMLLFPWDEFLQVQIHRDVRKNIVLLDHNQYQHQQDRWKYKKHKIDQNDKDDRKRKHRNTFTSCSVDIVFVYCEYIN